MLSPDDLAWAADLYGRGWTLVQLVGEFGIDKKTMRNRLVQFGMMIRAGGRGHWTTRTP